MKKQSQSFDFAQDRFVRVEFSVLRTAGWNLKKQFIPKGSQF